MANHPNRNVNHVAPPPTGTSVEDDRDEACVEALEPHVTRLASRAVAAGWSDAEIAAALLALVVSEMRAKAGDAATRQTLASAIMQLDD